MNVHHLELFYHVAKHRGISAATRKMPYGIQQPAVSGQLLQLEKSLGLQLFQRRPFALTPAGRELLAFAEPFFGGLGQISRRLRAEEHTRLRLAAPATILRDHLPELLRTHKRKYRDLNLQLHDANQATAERLLQKHEIDLAVTELEGKPVAGSDCTILSRILPVLIAPSNIKARTAADLWREGKGTETLISLPSDEVMVKQFHSHLRKLGVNWRTRIEVSALDLIPIYVSLGFGVGLSLANPRMKMPPGLRIIPLRGFPPLVIAALAQKNLSAPAASFLAAIKRRAGTTFA